MHLSQIGAGEGNRTLVVSLEGFCSTIELHPRFPKMLLTANVDPIIRSLKLRPPFRQLVEGVGFEPT